MGKAALQGQGGGKTDRRERPLPGWPVRGAMPREEAFWGGPVTFLVFGKKGSHLSLSGADGAFSAVLDGRASRSRMPVWLM